MLLKSLNMLNILEQTFLFMSECYTKACAECSQIIVTVHPLNLALFGRSDIGKTAMMRFMLVVKTGTALQDLWSIDCHPNTFFVYSRTESNIFGENPVLVTAVPVLLKSIPTV